MLSWRPRPPGRRLWSMAAQGSPNPTFANATPRALQDYVLRHARRLGARRVQVHIVDPGPGLDPLEPSWRRYLGRDTKAHPAFLSYLLRLRKVEALWNVTRAAGEYSHVVLVRDDTHFVDDVRLADFPDPSAVYSQPFGFLCSRRDPVASVPDMPSDHVLVLGGEAAGRLLGVYGEYFGNPSPLLDEVLSVEHFWLVLARLKECPARAARPPR
ncbi:unnamed protein product [Prorocentrum cordatum]|uniref:Uncharacterized protein n=1 Tax=Prorocentrum cordatum TaxID=2364126 RepID=A0ABN9VAL8_9DINO|nr:unnamed protein product [Polarella glacialis]